MKLIRIIITVVIILALWHSMVKIFNIPAYIIPGPVRVWHSWIDKRGMLLENSLITMAEAFLGFAIANLVSVIIAIFISFHAGTENIIMPIAIAIKTMPVIALVPLLIIWFGSGASSKAAAAMLVCFFPALVNVLRGVKSLDKKLVWLFKVYSANKRQMIEKLIFPSILPYLFAALKTSSSLAVVGALVGEFIGSNKGLGFLIMSNYYNMNTSLVFAAIITSNIIGLSFYYLIDHFEKRMVFSETKIKEGRDKRAPRAFRYLDERR